MDVSYSFAYHDVVHGKSRGITSRKSKSHTEPECPAAQARVHHSWRINLNQYLCRFHDHDTQTFGNKNLPKSPGKVESGAQQWPYAESKTENETQDDC